MSNIKKIPLSQGLWAVVSAEDFDFVNQYKWSASNESKNRRKWYAIRMVKDPITGKQRRITMHRFILGLDQSDKRVVDHIDNDSLDNRRENLQIITQEENLKRAGGFNGYRRKLKHDTIAKQNRGRAKRKKISKAAERTRLRNVQGSLISEIDSEPVEGIS